MGFWNKKNDWKDYEWQQKQALYKQYLLSDKWAEKRSKMMDIAGYACEVCKSTNNLQVHHLTYDHLYNEKPSDLVVVCGKHHKKLDKNRKHSSSQSKFARMSLFVLGENWRYKMSFIDALKQYGQNAGQDFDKTPLIFGVELKEWK